MIQVDSDGRYDVHWPRAARRVASRQLAPRLDTLNGKVVAQLWDFLFRGDEVFALLEEGLRERYPGVQFVSWREFGNTHGRNEREVLASLTERFRALGVQAAISGMGC